jgi:hypothetical protein
MCYFSVHNLKYFVTSSETSLFTVICGVMLIESQGQLYVALCVSTQYT